MLRIYLQNNLTSKSWENYKKNPIVLDNHCYHNVIGKAIIKEDDDGVDIGFVIKDGCAEIFERGTMVAFGFIHTLHNKDYIEILEISIC